MYISPWEHGGTKTSSAAPSDEGACWDIRSRWCGSWFSPRVDKNKKKKKKEVGGGPARQRGVNELNESGVMIKGRRAPCRQGGRERRSNDTVGEERTMGRLPIDHVMRERERAGGVEIQNPMPIVN